MNSNPNKSVNEKPAEFDELADSYRDVHVDNIAITGELPEYFARHKISDLRDYVDKSSLPDADILDFGSGIGGSLPYFREYFPESRVTCADVSLKSLDVAKNRFPGVEKYLHIEDVIPVPTASQDIVFSACVFHHIPHEEHAHWLKEVLRVVRPGGILAIYEHNPLNPLTRHAVNTCPLDVNAHLIGGGEMRRRTLGSNWERAEVAYKVFFPAKLSAFRVLEKHMEWLPLGAQYRLISYKSK